MALGAAPDHCTVWRNTRIRSGCHGSQPHNRGGGTAGIDFGLSLLAKLLGEDIAKMTQLALDYDPAPPFDAGSLNKAREKITRMEQDWIGPLSGKFAKACEAASTNMNHYASKP